MEYILVLDIYYDCVVYMEYILVLDIYYDCVIYIELYVFYIKEKYDVSRF